MKEMISINRSWISGHYRNIAGLNVCIFSNMDTVSIDDPDDNSTSYYYDGAEGCQIIDQITEIWLTGNCTQDGAVEQWLRCYIL